MKDSQRKRVYAWESSYRQNTNFGPRTPDILNLIQVISEDHFLPVPKVVFRDGGKSSYYNDGVITMSCYSLQCIIHECCHYICESAGVRLEPHDGLFVRTLIECLDTYAKYRPEEPTHLDVAPISSYTFQKQILAMQCISESTKRLEGAKKWLSSI